MLIDIDCIDRWIELDMAHNFVYKLNQFLSISSILLIDKKLLILVFGINTAFYP